MANQYHIEAEQKREEGDFEQALISTDKSILEYQKDKDYQGMAEVISSRYLTFIHLFDKTGDNSFLVLAVNAAQSSVEIASLVGDLSATVIPLYNLAKSYERQDNLEKAINSYQEAIARFKTNPPISHNHPSVLLDMQIHLGICELKNGNTSIYDKVLGFVDELQRIDDDAFRKDVWVSGAHLKLAEALHTTDPENSKLHLEKAEQIINNNDLLVLRKNQLNTLKSKLS